MFKFNLFGAMLCLLTLNLMAQTVPRPAGPYFEPLLDWQSGISKRDIVIAPGDSIIPQIANSGTPQDGGFYMIFQASNVSTTMAMFQVDFFDSNGESMNMPLPTSPDDLTGTPARGFQGTLSPGGYGAQVTIPDGSPTAIGYAVVTMNPAESVAVNATFLQLVPGRPLFMAGVPLSSVLHKTAFMPYLSGAGFTPTLALVSLQSQDVTLIARTGFDGAELCRATMDFGAGHHQSFLLRDKLSCTSTSEGTLEIRGDPLLPGSITGIGFEAHDEGAFVTQPIWTSLARVTGEMFAPADEAAFNDLFVGKRVVTNYPTVYADFVSPGRFRETEGADTSTGSYTYRNTGSNTGTVTFNYDDGDRCTASLTFDSTTSGTATSMCDDGSRGDYDWRLVEIPNGGENGGGTEDIYTPLDGWFVSDGRVQFIFFSTGRCIQLKGISLNGLTYTAHTSKWQRRTDENSAWTDIPGTENTDGICSYSPTEPGQYRGVAEISIDGESGMYSSKNFLTVEP